MPRNSNQRVSHLSFCYVAKRCIMKLNHTPALILTLVADFFLLFLGACLISFLGIGGTFVFLIEFYFIRSIHRTIYKYLTGNGQSEDDLSLKNSDETVFSKTHDTEPPQSLEQEIQPDISVEVLDESDFEQLDSEGELQMVKHDESKVQQKEPLVTTLTRSKKKRVNNKTMVGVIITVVVFLVFLILIISKSSDFTTGLTPKKSEITQTGNENIKEEPSSSNKTIPDSYKTDDERWDADNCVYSNFKYGFSFMLPCDVAWHLTSGTSKHTVFKIVQPDTEITMFVNVHPLTNIKGDMWDNYNLFVNQVLPTSMNATNANSAEQVNSSRHEKCEFCGKHAIKVEYESTLYDDRYDAPIDIKTINYVFIHHGALTTLALKSYTNVNETLLEDGYNVESLLTSFSLIPTKGDLTIK